MTPVNFARLKSKVGSSAIKVIPTLQGAHRLDGKHSIVSVSNNMKSLSCLMPVHVSAVNACAIKNLTDLKRGVLRDIRDMGTTLDNIDAVLLRNFIKNSPLSKTIGLPDLITAMSFNAKIGEDKVQLPLIVGRDEKLKVDKITLLAGGEWWAVDFYGFEKESMASKKINLTSEIGLTASRRYIPMVKLASGFNSEITITNIRSKVSVNAKDIRKMHMLGGQKGATIRIDAEGSDAKEAVDAITHFIKVLKHKH